MSPANTSRKANLYIATLNMWFSGSLWFSSFFPNWIFLDLRFSSILKLLRHDTGHHTSESYTKRHRFTPAFTQNVWENRLRAKTTTGVIWYLNFQEHSLNIETPQNRSTVVSEKPISIGKRASLSKGMCREHTIRPESSTLAIWWWWSWISARWSSGRPVWLWRFPVPCPLLPRQGLQMK